MNSRKLIIIGDDEKEIRSFLELAIAAGSLSVQLGASTYAIEIRRETVSEEGRRFLTKGGPLSTE
ncbi:hypothetical protein [Ensifer sp. Root127]|uniref:hypothetical protein n=1 Tax=Ensifer sp. Root127 TaxID=1736440 RepID=UPI00070D9282|nr:hypothetical protein [Ensifer sp. Root127]KQW82039.1 hypothetical protein ASD03_23255 [Ensifer sp. Root127]